MQYTGNADISRYVVDCLYGRDNKYSDWDIYVYKGIPLWLHRNHKHILPIIQHLKQNYV